MDQQILKTTNTKYTRNTTFYSVIFIWFKGFAAQFLCKFSRVGAEVRNAEVGVRNAEGCGSEKLCFRTSAKIYHISLCARFFAFLLE